MLFRSGAGINALQSNAVNQLALGPGQTVAGSSLDTIAGAKPIDIAGLDKVATPVGAQPSSLQIANVPTTVSDVGQYGMDKTLTNMISGNATPVPTPADITQYGLKVPGTPANTFGVPDMSGQIEGIYPGVNAPTQFNPNLSYSSQEIGRAHV